MSEPVPCLPSSFDRFESTDSYAPQLKAARSNLRAWVVLSRPGQDATSGSEDDSPKADSTVTIHPEGAEIWHTDHVVSNRPIDEFTKKIGHALLEKADFKPRDRATAFVMLCGTEIHYYLIDHDTDRVLWAKGDDVPATVRRTDPLNMQNLLHEEFWVHMENFPGPVPATANHLAELKKVLVGLAVDSCTSDGSTSPFSASRIQEFLALLNTFSMSHKLGIQETYAIARLWCMLWRARTINQYGTNRACLDRFTPLTEKPTMFRGIYALLARFFIGADANAHLARCSRAWAGRTAYVTEWKNFKVKNESEWTQTMHLACVLAIASILIRTQSTVQFFPTVALALACVSAASCYHLINESRNLGDHAADAAAHFQLWEEPQHGIQKLSIRNAAPRAILTWAFLVFMLSIF